MSFEFVRRKYGSTRVGKAFEITESNKQAIKTESGTDVVINDNGFAVVANDGGYSTAQVGDYFISYTVTEGKSDSEVVALAEYKSMFETVASLKKPNPAVGSYSTAGFLYEDNSQAKFTFIANQDTITASLNEGNNDDGHQFDLGTLSYKGPNLEGPVTLSIKDQSLSTYKLKLKESSILVNDSVEVAAILQRARKDQRAAVVHDCPVTLTVNGNEFTFTIKININPTEVS